MKQKGGGSKRGGFEPIGGEFGFKGMVRCSARRRRPWLYIWWKPWSQCPGLDGRVLLRAIVVLGECVLG